MPTNDKGKPKVIVREKIVYRDAPAPPPPENESIFDSIMPMLKKDYNWKIVLGIAIGFLLKAMLG